MPEVDTERDTARIAELRRLRVFDSPESGLELIAQTAAALFNVPIVLVSLVDRERQWFKARFGTALRETPREHAICAHAIQDPERIFVVRDAIGDPRFSANPLVTGEPHLRFYAGAPLVSSRGVALGTICLIDRRPRRLSVQERHTLHVLSEVAMGLIERASERDAQAPLTLRPGDDPVSPVAVFGWNSRKRITRWNSAAQTMLGWSPAEVAGRFPPFVLAADRARFSSDCSALLRGSLDVIRLYSVRTKDGRDLQVIVSATRDVDARGRVSGVSTIEEVGRRIEAGRRLVMLESIAINSTDAVIVLAASQAGDVANRVMYVNEMFTRITGYSAGDVAGGTLSMLAGPATDNAALKRVSDALARGQALTEELVEYRKDGSPFSVELRLSPVLDTDGSCMYFVAIERETTTRRALERYEQSRGLLLEMAVRNEPLERQLAHLVTLLKSVVPGSLGSLMLVQEHHLRLAAADPDLPAAYVAAIDGAPIGPDVGSCGSAVYRREAVLCGDIMTDERWRDYRAVAFAAGVRACWSIPFFATNGDVLGALALNIDRPALPTTRERQLFEETVRFASLVVERHRDRQRLERMARHDALTNLPQRNVVEDELLVAMQRAQTQGRIVALVVLDIKNFKAINDAFGHSVGDRLLSQIADRLRRSVPRGAVVGRMGGDEFSVVFPDLSDTTLGIDAAARLNDALGAGFHLDGYEIFVRPSLGVAFYPAMSTDLFGLFAAADKAMYASKLRGGGLELALAPIAGPVPKSLDLETDLRYALEREQFELHYQLLYDLSDGRPVGAEALLRWNHARLGTIEPADFVPLAEANGTIVAIGAWVIDEAARTARTWQDGGRDAFVTVNVSALMFDAPGLVPTVVQALERHALEPHRLHLELTESLVMRNPSVSETTFTQLKALGVHIIIDDFGTGFSSLAYLQRFAFDALKIDREFVRNIGEGVANDRSERIVTAVVSLASALGVMTIAEGVEDAAQYAFIAASGCTLAQGFFCARPVPAADVGWDRSVYAGDRP